MLFERRLGRSTTEEAPGPIRPNWAAGSSLWIDALAPLGTWEEVAVNRATRAVGAGGRAERKPRRPRLRRVGDVIQATCANGHRVADLDQEGGVYILCRCKQLVNIVHDDLHEFLRGSDKE